MPPKTRNGEGSSKGPSLQPILSQKLPPPPPRQRRCGGRSGAVSATVQSGSLSRGVIALSRQDVPPLEQPRQSKEHTKRGEKSITKQGEVSVLAKSQSHHQANPDDNDDPLIEDIRAQNLVIQEKDELIRQLRHQLRERRKAPSPPPRRGQPPPSAKQDLRHVLNNKRRDRVYDEGSSNSHMNEESKKQRQ